MRESASSWLGRLYYSNWFMGALTCLEKGTLLVMVHRNRKQSTRADHLVYEFSGKILNPPLRRTVKAHPDEERLNAYCALKVGHEMASGQASTHPQFIEPTDSAAIGNDSPNWNQRLSHFLNSFPSFLQLIRSKLDKFFISLRKCRIMLPLIIFSSCGKWPAMMLSELVMTLAWPITLLVESPNKKITIRYYWFIEHWPWRDDSIMSLWGRPLEKPGAGHWPPRLLLSPQAIASDSDSEILHTPNSYFLSSCRCNPLSRPRNHVE